MAKKARLDLTDEIGAESASCTRWETEPVDKVTKLPLGMRHYWTPGVDKKAKEKDVNVHEAGVIPELDLYSKSISSKGEPLRIFEFPLDAAQSSERSIYIGGNWAEGVGGIATYAVESRCKDGVGEHHDSIVTPVLKSERNPGEKDLRHNYRYWMDALLEVERYLPPGERHDAAEIHAWLRQEAELAGEDDKGLANIISKRAVEAHLERWRYFDKKAGNLYGAEQSQALQQDDAGLLQHEECEGGSEQRQHPKATQRQTIETLLWAEKQTTLGKAFSPLWLFMEHNKALHKQRAQSSPHLASRRLSAEDEQEAVSHGAEVREGPTDALSPTSSENEQSDRGEDKRGEAGRNAGEGYAGAFGPEASKKEQVQGQGLEQEQEQHRERMVPDWVREAAEVLHPTCETTSKALHHYFLCNFPGCPVSVPGKGLKYKALKLHWSRAHGPGGEHHAEGVPPGADDDDAPRLWRVSKEDWEWAAHLSDDSLNLLVALQQLAGERILLLNEPYLHETLSIKGLRALAASPLPRSSLADTPADVPEVKFGGVHLDNLSSKSSSSKEKISAPAGQPGTKKKEKLAITHHLHLDGWGSLEANLLHTIFERLDEGSLLAAGGVCRGWRSLSGDDDIWSRFYARKWGALPKERPSRWARKSTHMGWKEAYLHRASAPPESFICPYCGKALKHRNGSAARAHTNTHLLPIRCSHRSCKTRFATQRALVTHLARDHGEAYRLSHECTVCGVRLPQLNKLRIHLLRAHQQELPKELAAPQKGYRCQTIGCDKVFARWESILCHCEKEDHMMSLDKLPQARRKRSKKLNR
eukprot:jgi/Mesen1/4314/ME000022S03605